VTAVRFVFWAALLTLFFVYGCASKTGGLAKRFEQKIELENTPFYAQGKYQCGPASLAMLLEASGVKVHPDELAPLTYLPGRRGSLQLELAAACRKYDRIPYVINPELSALVAELRAGRPVLVLQNLGLKVLPAYHYAVVIGMLPDNEIILRSGTDRRLEMDISRFLNSWNRSGAWGVIALAPGELPATIDQLRYLRAVNDFETKGNVLSARKAYQAALVAWPENQAALFALGNNYLAQKNPKEAEALFRKVLSINSDHVAAANNLAETLMLRECYTQAEAVINSAVQNAKRINTPLFEQIRKSQQEISQHLKEIRQPRKYPLPEIDKDSDRADINCL
jgi:hypothetical protein